MTKKEKGLFDQPQKDRRPWARMGVLMALLLTAGLLLWKDIPRGTAKDSKATPPPAVQTASPTEGRTAREQAYDKDIAALRQLMEEKKADQALLDQAAKQMMLMVQNHQIELGVEEALSHAGFASCWVLMQNDALTVTLSQKELTAEDSATILAICVAHSEVAPENVRMMTAGGL